MSEKDIGECQWMMFSKYRKIYQWRSKGNIHRCQKILDNIAKCQKIFMNFFQGNFTLGNIKFRYWPIFYATWDICGLFSANEWYLNHLMSVEYKGQYIFCYWIMFNKIWIFTEIQLDDLQRSRKGSDRLLYNNKSFRILLQTEIRELN